MVSTHYKAIKAFFFVCSCSYFHTVPSFAAAFLQFGVTKRLSDEELLSWWLLTKQMGKNLQLSVRYRAAGGCFIILLQMYSL